MLAAFPRPTLPNQLKEYATDPLDTHILYTQTLAYVLPAVQLAIAQAEKLLLNAKPEERARLGPTVPPPPPPKHPSTLPHPLPSPLQCLLKCLRPDM